MKKLSIVLLLLWSSVIFAEGDSLNGKWKPDGVGGINLSQIAFTNWAKGGENSLSWIFFSNVGLSYEATHYKLKNNFKFAYGRTKLGDAAYRTNDNEVYLENVLAYNVGWAVDPFISNTFRTNVSAGYDYKTTLSPKVSDFFDPAYITQAIGFEYGKSKQFVTRLGLAFQETFANKFRSYSDDPDTPELEAFKFETGLESVTSTEFLIDDNLLYTGKLRLFSRFDRLAVWDVRWDHLITAKINSYLNVNFGVLVLYEKDQSPKTQLKEALQVGFTYNLF